LLSFLVALSDEPAKRKVAGRQNNFTATAAGDQVSGVAG
jgi:hypothetical protein